MPCFVDKEKLLKEDDRIEKSELVCVLEVSEVILKLLKFSSLYVQVIF